MKHSAIIPPPPQRCPRSARCAIPNAKRSESGELVVTQSKAVIASLMAWIHLLLACETVLEQVQHSTYRTPGLPVLCQMTSISKRSLPLVRSLLFSGGCLVFRRRRNFVLSRFISPVLSSTAWSARSHDVYLFCEERHDECETPLEYARLHKPNPGGGRPSILTTLTSLSRVQTPEKVWQYVQHYGPTRQYGWRGPLFHSVLGSSIANPTTLQGTAPSQGTSPLQCSEQPQRRFPWHISDLAYESIEITNECRSSKRKRSKQRDI